MKTWKQSLIITGGLFVFSILAFSAKIKFLSLANLIAYPLIFYYLSGIGAGLIAFFVVGLVVFILSYFLLSLLKSFKRKDRLR